MPTQPPTHERFIALLDGHQGNAIYRVGLGYLIPLLYYSIASEEDSGWFFVLWFLCVLIALRVLPAVFRKVLSFTREIEAIWSQRRRAAKRYDSYQWRKLFWFGLGMACYVAVSGDGGGIVGALSAFCTIGGGVGFICWRNRCVAENVVVE